MTQVTPTGKADTTEVPEIGPDEVKNLVKVGGGQFGSVFKGECRGKIVAVKKLFAKIDEKSLEEFRKEVAILTHLRHPNVVLFMGACTEPGNLFIVTEYMPMGDIGKIIHGPQKLPDLKLLKMGSIFFR